MESMGLHQNWINLIMKCTSSITYSVLINGQPQGLIHSSHGLHQGCPLSPYLFLLCTEGLSSILKKRIQTGDLCGIRAARLGLALFLRMIVSYLLEPNLKIVSLFWVVWRSTKMP